MKRGKSGSLIIVAVVAVAVITMLALSLATSLRAHAAAADENSYRRETRQGCLNAVMRCVAERLTADTNGWDALTEEWAEPYERRAEEWVWRVSGTGWQERASDTAGLIDESGFLPLNGGNPELLKALLKSGCALSDGAAEKLAAEIDKAGPYVCLEQLITVPGVTPEIFNALTPYLTVFAVEHVNINTAPEKVLRAVFEFAGTHDAAAAHSLYVRIRDYRNAGNSFTSASPQIIAKSLGGLPSNEALLLSYCQNKLTAASDIFSGIAEATPARYWEAGRHPGRAHFTYDRKKRVFLRWVEE